MMQELAVGDQSGEAGLLGCTLFVCAPARSLLRVVGVSDRDKRRGIRSRGVKTLNV